MAVEMAGEIADEMAVEIAGELADEMAQNQSPQNRAGASRGDYFSRSHMKK